MSRLQQTSTASNIVWNHGYDGTGNRTLAMLSGQSSRTDVYAIASGSSRLEAIMGRQGASFAQDANGDATLVRAGSG
ncbi:hypothetical protein [Xanthomonas massiliensis]|uniref:hypothetical protein n=1 Tax=Xanthomonas massiliensis TaxID=1720302 RepID=UPI0008252F98|nr:hypothetical protein [Xanthomonas massiliensis]